MKTAQLKKGSFKFTAWMIGLGILTAAGLSAIVSGFIQGHEVTFNTSTGVPWGLLISTYLFFVLPASGLCVLSSLGHIFGIKEFEPLGKRAILLAMVLLLSGFLVIGSDLERPWLMALYVLVTPNPTSAIWWMGTLYAIYFLVLIVEFTFLNRTAVIEKIKASEPVNLVERILALGAGKKPDLSIERSKMLTRIFGVAALGLAVTALSTLGGVFGLIGSRALWHGPMLPVYFILSALLAGGAVLILATVLSNWASGGEMRADIKESVITLGKLLLITLGVYFLFNVWILLTAQYGRVPADFEAVMVLINGPLAGSFWILEVSLGMLLPVVILFKARSGKIWGITTASALVIVGLFASRFDFIVAGQLVPIVGREELWQYRPSFIEVMTVLAAVFLCLFLYSLGNRIFPIQHKEAHGEENFNRVLP